tara:strand:+ start:775 stop:1062 length:288 start_codon:yes stop_codon:yes gene_type:complete
MNNLDELRNLIGKILTKKEYKKRKMKRVFQWGRYIQWKDLTPEEKLSAKRILLLPLFTYILLTILNQNLSLIILLLMGYFLYKKYQKQRNNKTIK